jgi:hypothetical protein
MEIDELPVELDDSMIVEPALWFSRLNAILFFVTTPQHEAHYHK